MAQESLSTMPRTKTANAENARQGMRRLTPGARPDGAHSLDPDERPGKRHFYADFEPALACLSYALCSSALSLFNKLVFSGVSFNFPTSVLAFQSLCAVVFLLAGDCLRLSEPSPITRGAPARQARRSGRAGLWAR